MGENHKIFKHRFLSGNKLLITQCAKLLSSTSLLVVFGDYCPLVLWSSSFVRWGEALVKDKLLF